MTTLPAKPPPPPERASDPAAPPPRTRSLKSMRRMATGLLLLMTALFVVTHVWGSEGGAWGYARAFAEAAMVGGLADWFAVTALFRRPLGLPIPHTAVIPRNQDRIADAVGRFIAENFLDPNLVEERTRDKDLAEGVGKWLSEPSQARAVAEGAVSALPGLIDAMDDETVATFLKQQAGEAANSLKAAAIVGSVLDALVQQGRHQAILDAALQEGFRLLYENEHRIRTRVRDNTGWLLRVVKVDRDVANTIIDAIEDLLHEIARDPHHPVRQRITEAVAGFAADLKDDPVMQRRVEGWITDALRHPTVSGAFEAGWREAKEGLLADCRSKDGKLVGWLEGTLKNLGEGLLREAGVRQSLNGRMRTMLVSLADRHGQDISQIVSETIRSWDTRTVVEKLEANVGKDLQFIRVNGTLIGGLVGLALHAGAELL
ncbi:MAG: DUF445 domain-containing protein [Hyphomonadaceae bacterium]